MKRKPLDDQDSLALAIINCPKWGTRILCPRCPVRKRRKAPHMLNSAMSGSDEVFEFRGLCEIERKRLHEAR